MAGPLLTDGINLGARLGTPRAEVQPPEGWFPFGTHMGEDLPMVFSEEEDENGHPLWERPALGDEKNGSAQSVEPAPEDEGHDSGHVGDENADPTGSKDSERGQGPGEGDSPADGESVPLAERLAGMTIPEIEKAIEEGEFTAQEAADTEATFDEPRVGVLSLGTN